ncbi:TraB/GumN family protein, partial [bacterium]|nr:TraB/GumN family protein [bacterium]
SLELGLNIAQMNKFKPWFFTVNMLGMKIIKMGFDPKFGVDRYFFDKAKLMGKEIIGLESIEYQVNLFADFIEDEQEDLVLQTLKEMDILEEELKNIVTAWMKGDIDELNNQILQSFREYPKIYKKLILQRNLNWMPHLDALLHQGKNVFIVVGAGHLLGEKGLIQLLIDKGYSVKQL